MLSRLRFVHRQIDIRWPFGGVFQTASTGGARGRGGREAYAPDVFNRAGMLAGASGFMGCAAAVAGSLWRARQNRLVTTSGSSRWANKREIEGAGLFRATGVFLGRLGGRYLRHDGPEHVMAFAPTRSGNRAGQRITERNLDIQPTITVRPGWPLRVIVHKDLVFR